MGRWLYLSYLIDKDMPVYGDSEPFGSVAARSISKGDTCNTQRWSMSNHIGTHIDFPRHFYRNGNVFQDYPTAFWICRKVKLIDLSPVSPGAIIASEDLDLASLPHDLELLLVKTGFSNFRSTSRYRENNPAFSPHIASRMRAQCPRLRMFGFDAISLSSWSNRLLGRQAHRAFLKSSEPILILEDLDLSSVDQKTSFLQLIVAPLAVSDADGAPCLLLAEVSQ